MTAYLTIRESQLHLYKKAPLYYQPKENEFALYKKSGDLLEPPRISEKKYPELFIKSQDKAFAQKELFAAFNTNLADQALSTDLNGVRSALKLIVSEAIEAAGSEAFTAIPETIEVLFDGFSQRTELLDALVGMKSSSGFVVEHTINVLILTFRYGFFHQLKEREIKRLALAAFFHDIGTSEVDKEILDTDRRLTDDEYEIYKTHTAKGCDILLKRAGFDPLVATVAQEHHERIDGTGYPYGKTNPCFESQLIGLIDCYEPLTYRDKTHRKAKKPFDSLQLIKEEVLQGRFRQDIFKDLCSCLTVKS